jgi:hypothetical protein
MTIPLLMGRLPRFPPALLPKLQKPPLFWAPLFLLLPLRRRGLPERHRTRLLPWSPTGHPNGPGLPLRMGFLAQRLSRNRMGLSAVLLAIPSIRRLGVPSATALCASCTRPASAIAARARCANSVKNRARRSSRDG